MFVLELTLLVSASIALLAVVGLGPMVLLGPDLGGIELFLAPFVGLAILYWVSQLLSPHFASGPVIVTTCFVCGLASLTVVSVRRRDVLSKLVSARVDLSILMGAGVVIAMILQLPMLHDGTFTLSDFSGDDLFTWSPTAAYMQTHSFAAGHPTAYVSPLLWVLPTNIYPGSAGTVDGGLLSVFGLHAYQFVEPFSAVCLALGACAVYLLLRSALHSSRLIAVLGLVLVATNPSRFFTAGSGLAQSARGTCLMMAALVLLLYAFDRRSVGSAILAGGITAVLAGVYMPTFLITASAVLGAVIVVLAPLVRRSARSIAWRPLVAFVVSGLVFGIQNIRWLLLGGGLHNWVLQTHYGRALFVFTWPLQYLIGTAPMQFLLGARGAPPSRVTSRSSGTCTGATQASSLACSRRRLPSWGRCA